MRKYHSKRSGGHKRGRKMYHKKGKGKGRSLRTYTVQRGGGRL